MDRASAQFPAISASIPAPHTPSPAIQSRHPYLRDLRVSTQSSMETHSALENDPPIRPALDVLRTLFRRCRDSARAPTAARSSPASAPAIFLLTRSPRHTNLCAPAPSLVPDRR